MDPVFLAGLGIGLIKAVAYVLEKGVVDPALDKGLTGLRAWVTRGYDQASHESALRKALVEAENRLAKAFPDESHEQFAAATRFLNLPKPQIEALATGGLEMARYEPDRVPPELLQTLGMKEADRAFLARFLALFHDELGKQKEFREAIYYANELDHRGHLAGLTRMTLQVQADLNRLTAYHQALAKERRLTIEDADALKNYIEWACKRWSNLMLPLIRKKAEAITHAALRQVYVPLLLREMDAGREEKQPRTDRSRRVKKPEMPDREAVEPLNLGKLLQDHPHFILIGSPGSGKSTLLQRAALAFLEGRSAEDLDWQDAPLLLPVLVRLRNFNEFLSTNSDRFTEPSSGALAAYLDHFFREIERVEITADFFDARLREGGCLILLDGLDEVADERAGIARHVTAFIHEYAPRGNRIGLSSRPRGYQSAAGILRPARLAEVEVNPLDQAGITQLLANLLGIIEPEESRRKTDLDNLTGSIFASPDLSEIASIPMFCSALAQVYKYRGAGLPERRVDVLQEITDLLLGFWRIQQTNLAEAEGLALGSLARQRSLSTDAGIETQRNRISHLAYQMQERGIDDIGQEPALETMHDYIKRRERRSGVDPADAAEQFLLDATECSGLLVERERGLYAFIHKSFREYLAAAALINHREEELITVVTARLGDDFWEEVLCMAASHRELPDDTRSVLLQDVIGYIQNLSDAERKSHCVQTLAKMAPDMGDLLYGEDYEAAQTYLLDCLRSETLPTLGRVKAGLALARLGDPRFRDDLFFLPAEDLLGFVKIPSGPFEMGSLPDEGAEDEQPRHTVDLPACYIGRYPVTTAQFSAFCRKQDYRPRDPNCLRGPANHPVVNVTWHDALAYCRWLDAALRQDAGTPPALRTLLAEGWQVTLPSEAEWEKGARGGDARLYPWGSEFEPSRANTSESGTGGTSAVGAFPAGRSPLDLLDMSGNVWEWTRSLWGKDWGKPEYGYPYSDRIEERESLAAGDETLRILRGGAWNGDQWLARCAYRDWLNPLDWSHYIGFRCALSRSF